MIGNVEHTYGPTTYKSIENSKELADQEGSRSPHFALGVK